MDSPNSSTPDVEESTEDEKSRTTTDGHNIDSDVIETLLDSAAMGAAAATAKAMESKFAHLLTSPTKGCYS